LLILTGPTGSSFIFEWSSSGIFILVSDLQNDFHDMRECPVIGESFCNRTQAVPGACEDSLRISEMIATQYEAIDEIIVTLDSHHVSPVYFS
jgi:hypothetical protein